MTPPTDTAFVPAPRAEHPRFRAERAARVVVGVLVVAILSFGFA